MVVRYPYHPHLASAGQDVPVPRRPRMAESGPHQGGGIKKKRGPWTALFACEQFLFYHFTFFPPFLIFLRSRGVPSHACSRTSRASS